MSANTADRPAILASLEAEKIKLNKRLEEIDRLISGYDSWYSLASLSLFPQTQNSQQLNFIDSNANALSTATIASNNQDRDSGETLTSRIIGFLDARPSLSFSPMEIAEALGVNPNEVNARTNYLVNKKRIVKVARGLYRSIHSTQHVAA